MTDPFQGRPEHFRHRAISGCRLSIAGSIILLTIFVVPGCNDSQSDEYKEFSDLEIVVAEREVATQEPTTETVEPVPTPALENTEAEPPVDQPPLSPNPDESSPADEPAVPAGDLSATEPAAPEPEATPAQPIKLLIPHRNFRKEGKALRASFDDIDLLKVLNMDPVPMDAADHFPEWLNELNGKHVRIRGYMRPGFELEGITQFLFVRDNGECCYGPLPKIYDMIAVELADGESSDLIEGTPFDVEGTFRIEPHADEIELYGLFFIDDGVIIE